MNYQITCVCGEKIKVEAQNGEEAVTKMVQAMDQHVASKEHPEVPKDLTAEQKIGMVKSQMKEV